MHETVKQALTLLVLVMLACEDFFYYLNISICLEYLDLCLYTSWDYFFVSICPQLVDKKSWR